MNKLRRYRLHLLAAGLASITALIHLYLGLTEVIRYVTTGHTLKLLSILFALSALAIIAGMLAFSRGAPRQPIYLLGMLLMVVYLVRYADWHVFGTADSLLGLEDAGHDHANGHDHAREPTEEEDESTLQSPIANLTVDPFALVSKTAEILLLLLLSVLYYVGMDRNVETNVDATR